MRNYIKASKSRKFISVLAVCLMAASCCLIGMVMSNAADAIDSGNCGLGGANVTWTLYDDGELVISGFGKMRNYEDSMVPWRSHRDSIEKITIEAGVISIGDWAFYGCHYLQSVSIPEGVTSIGCSSFFECITLKSITLPDSVISINVGAFSYCASLQTINIPDGVTRIEHGVFEYCSDLTSIALPDGIYAIDYAAFRSCESLQTITIPDGVTSIDSAAFKYCFALASATIPYSVSSIQPDAFDWCENLTIYGYDGSCAERYAAENYFPFVSLGEHTHYWIYDVYEYPNCGNSGYQRKWCPCGEETYENIPATEEHNFVWETYEYPDCQSPGYKSQYCTNCEATGNSETIPPLGHDFSWTITAPPTCQWEGSEEKRCIVCDEFFGCESIPRLEHTAGVVETYPPICEEYGWSLMHCPICGIYFDDNYVQPLGHDYDPWILAIAPTADAYGVEIRVCNACLKLDYRVVEKLSQGGGDCTHEWEAANCTAPKMCRLCNYIEGAALGHDDGDGDGYCDICGDSLGSHGGLTPFHTCDCCDLHDHSDSFFDRISCFFCKLMQFFRNLFSFSQNAL